MPNPNPNLYPNSNLTQTLNLQPQNPVPPGDTPVQLLGLN